MLTLIIPLAAFWGLFFVSCFRFEYRQALWSKNKVAWTFDALGLLAQGWVIPLLQAFLLLPVLRYFAPQAQSVVDLPFWAAFLLSFVVVDYLYYWNHRTLHTQRLWPWHRVHHSATSMDIFVASRNSLWTHLLIVYVWVHSFSIFVLKDSTGYVLGIALSSALDLWRHSGMRFSSHWEKRIGSILILPVDHAWHHATISEGKNFGANFNLWDKFHGTWEPALKAAFEVGDKDHTLQFKDLIRPIPGQN
ncbi:MAG: sterol desaturase family protein [Chitinophagaceae bacterium]|nr:sterol desaturase family protein [Oligoflexus sp.]